MGSEIHIGFILSIDKNINISGAFSLFDSDGEVVLLAFQLKMGETGLDLAFGSVA